jgi:hypothetical protein
MNNQTRREWKRKDQKNQKNQKKKKDVANNM